MTERVRNTTLSIESLSLSFGGIQALSEVSLNGKGGEILGIIGPNGAGKTSLLNCVSGFYHPQKGSIYFEGKDVTKLPPHRIAELGVARTFQQIELFSGLSTLDNLMAARHIYMRSGVISNAIYFGGTQKEDIEHREVVEKIIDFLEMQGIRKKVVGSLPYGQRKRVELGRALALEPKLLLLDEPMAGMSAEEKQDMARFTIDILEERGIPIILVEHDMGVVMDICDKIVVLDFGKKIAEGSPYEIKANPQVIAAYLGKQV